MENIYTEAIHAAQSHELIASCDFRAMLRTLLQAPVIMATDDEADTYVRLNTMGCAKVYERGVHVQTFWGRDWKA